MAETSESLSINEALRRRFESAWHSVSGDSAREVGPPDVAEFLPAADDPRYASTLAELIVIDLEMAWRRGIPRTFEQYRSRFALIRGDRNLARKLVSQEFQIRQRWGDRPLLDDFRELYPEHADALSTVKNDVRPSAVGGGAAGEIDDRYRALAPHGKGGFGLVWRATDTTLGREVAVKQLTGAAAHDAEFRRRFLGEAKIAAQLQHPGVVPVYDIGGDPENPFYTMKLVAGQTLAEAIRRYHGAEVRSPVERLRLLNAFQSIVRTMAFVHWKGVLHRDLKPQNVILGEYGETIILDWGLAKILGDDSMLSEKGSDPLDSAGDNAPRGSRGLTPFRTAATADSGEPSADPELTRPGTVLGTPAYMSPEQAAGNVDAIDRRSDVFSLGVILFQLLTGARPFAGASSAEVCAKILSETPPRPRSLRPDIARPLEAICLRCLEKNPDARYADAVALNLDLERCFADEPVNAYREPLWFRALRWGRKHRSRIVNAVLACLLAGVVIGAVLVVRRYQSQRDDEATARLQEARDALRQDEDLALENVRRGDFAGAEHLLAIAVKKLDAWPELAEVRTRLEEKRKRAMQLATFYRRHDDGWRFNFHEYDDEATAAMKQALEALGVLDNARWWENLPVAELTEEQIRQLREDVHGLLLLYAGTIAKPALQDFPATRYKAHCKTALDLCRRAQSYQPTQAGTLLEIFCRYATGEINVFQVPGALREMPTRSPTTPTDLHFMGVGHMIMSWSDTPLKSYFKLLTNFGDPGLDFATPAFTSQRHLREITRLEPKRFWAYVWLGQSLKAQNDHLGAELAFNTCVTLRPDDADGLAGRGQALLNQADLAKTDVQKKLLIDRGRADYDHAVRSAPLEPLLRVLRCRALWKLGEFEASDDDLLSHWELRRPLSHLQDHGHRRQLERDLSQSEKSLRTADPKRFKIRGCLAYALAHQGRWDEALAAIDAIPAGSPESRRLAGLKAWIHVTRPDPDLNAADAALTASDPRAFRAAIARARLARLRGDLALAQSCVEEMDATPASWSAWQRLEILIERARVEIALGQSTDITLDRARRSHGEVVVDQLIGKK